MKKELYLGLDVHQEWILSAVAEPGRRGEVRDTGAIRCDLHAVEKWVGRLRKAHGKEVIVRACYEAGPCGFGIARRLKQLGVECEPTDEAMRDLCRARTDAVDDRRRSRHPSKRLRETDVSTNVCTKWLLRFEGQQLRLPKHFSPDSELLMRRARMATAVAVF